VGRCPEMLCCPRFNLEKPDVNWSRQDPILAPWFLKNARDTIEQKSKQLEAVRSQSEDDPSQVLHPSAMLSGGKVPVNHVNKELSFLMIVVRR
jgi:hypothetical protein